MKRLLAGWLCLLLLVCAQGGLAEDVAPGQFAQAAESAALEEGLEVRTEVSFAWGGLPLLDEATDKAVGSLLESAQLLRRRQGGEGSGYAAYDLLLKQVSVLDIAMHVIDGVYYEQSNLTGGQAVAFTQEEFGTFAARLSARTESVLPPNLDGVFSVVTSALAGTDMIEIDPETLDGAIAALEAWKLEALTETDRLRPKMTIPGLYGIRATVVDVTREELLDLAQAYSDLLAENETLWQDVVRAQMDEAGEEADEQTLTDTVLLIADILHGLPKTLEETLPENLAPAEYRTIFGPDDVMVARQLDISLPEDIHVYLEWVPEAFGVPSFYMMLDTDLASLELLITQERGEPQVGNKLTEKRDRMIAQMTYIEDALKLDVVMTRTQDVEQRADKETINIKTDWMMESEAIFGEGAVITVTAETADTASGAGKDYARKTESSWHVKGLGFDSDEIMSVSAKTTASAAEAPIDMTADAVRPGQMDEATFDSWIEEMQVSMMQAGFTVLGRLPSDVAAYILSIGK